ncbi:hypothetical protein Pint_06921 [Pistacia integerrima]|uniref:Uncharacterized protein n=1 Tax=Pistacia integerrima TaxID=434235 RepID=A0ACC0XSH7_9ROSI|nr:hypothetical protein Pint_06921 [Pistacia integerrima]
MADVVANQGGSFGDANDAQKNVFDLGAFVGDLTFEEDASGDDISLEGLAKELEEFKNYDVVENILFKGTTLRQYTKGVENDLRQIEFDSIQSEIGSISLDIKILQEKVMDMGLKLKNRKVWFPLGKFCIPEDSVVILILMEAMMVVKE